MGAFDGLGPYNGHWFPADRLQVEKEPNDKEEKEDPGYYIMWDHFFRNGMDSATGKWGQTGKWFDNFQKAEEEFSKLEQEGKKPVRWYKIEKEKS